MEAVETDIVTFEGYMAEPYLRRRFDIIDGVRTFKPTSWRHQRLLGHLTRALRDFERANRDIHLLFLPFDLMIRREPFRTRQPDAMFVSAERWPRRGADGEPLQVAPTVVFEILEKHETPETYRDALADYAEIGVEECWITNPQNATVSILRVTPLPTVRLAWYETGQTVQSVALPGLTLSLNAVFAE